LASSNIVVISSIAAANLAIYKCKDVHGGMLSRIHRAKVVSDSTSSLVLLIRGYQRLERAYTALDELAAKRRADEALEELRKRQNVCQAWQRDVALRPQPHRWTTNK
jgi:hypothetical protein